MAGHAWSNTLVWMIPVAAAILPSTPLALLYLDRLLRAGVKNAVIYAFSSWMIIHIALIVAIVRLASS